MTNLRLAFGNGRAREADPISGKQVHLSFASLLPVFDLVRFDPDIRAMEDVTEENRRKRIAINKAVSDIGGEVALYLTNSPHCFSALPPDTERIRHYKDGARNCIGKRIE